MAADEGQVAHAHGTAVSVVIVDGTNIFRFHVQVFRFEFLDKRPVNSLNNLQVARQHGSKHIQRPALERFGQQGVVGVGNTALRNLEGFLVLHAVQVYQQSDQFRNRDGGMSIVQLDCSVIRKRSEVIVSTKVTAQKILQ